jgi:hypothetical protein
MSRCGALYFFVWRNSVNWTSLHVVGRHSQRNMTWNDLKPSIASERMEPTFSCFLRLHPASGSSDEDFGKSYWPWKCASCHHEFTLVLVGGFSLSETYNTRPYKTFETIKSIWIIVSLKDQSTKSTKNSLKSSASHNSCSWVSCIVNWRVFQCVSTRFQVSSTNLIRPILITPRDHGFDHGRCNVRGMGWSKIIKPSNGGTRLVDRPLVVPEHGPWTNHRAFIITIIIRYFIHSCVWNHIFNHKSKAKYFFWQTYLLKLLPFPLSLRAVNDSAKT